MAKCKVCNESFVKLQSFQKWCSIDCAVVIARTNKEKEKRKQEREKEKEHREKLLSVKPLRHFERQAQAAFNRFIRERDADLPCISCQRHHQGQYHAGHYRTVGTFPECRFDEDNCHKQCSACNNYLSGNIENYRHNLIIKIGQDRFDALMGRHEKNNYRREDYERIKLIYRAKYKELKVKEL
jgi:hypothetical protein